MGGTIGQILDDIVRFQTMAASSPEEESQHSSFLVMASDGVWNALSNAQVCASVSQSLFGEHGLDVDKSFEEELKLVFCNSDLKLAAQRVIDHAASVSSSEDLTCMVLSWQRFSEEE